MMLDPKELPWLFRKIGRMLGRMQNAGMISPHRHYELSPWENYNTWYHRLNTHSRFIDWLFPLVFGAENRWRDDQ